MSKRAEANAIQVFFALGDGTRLSVVQRLGKGGAQSATMLADGAEVTRQAIGKHLQVLEGAGLVSHQKLGRGFSRARDGAADDAVFLEGSGRVGSSAGAPRTLVEEPSGKRR
jgi:DNA-binding transcriptional ArsR family regulator